MFIHVKQVDMSFSSRVLVSSERIDLSRLYLCVLIFPPAAESRSPVREEGGSSGGGTASCWGRRGSQWAAPAWGPASSHSRDTPDTHLTHTWHTPDTHLTSLLHFKGPVVDSGAPLWTRDDRAASPPPQQPISRRVFILWLINKPWVIKTSRWIESWCWVTDFIIIFIIIYSALFCFFVIFNRFDFIGFITYEIFRSGVNYCFKKWWMKLFIIIIIIIIISCGHIYSFKICSRCVFWLMIAALLETNIRFVFDIEMLFLRCVYDLMLCLVFLILSALMSVSVHMSSSRCYFTVNSIRRFY